MDAVVYSIMPTLLVVIGSGTVDWKEASFDIILSQIYILVIVLLCVLGTTFADKLENICKKKEESSPRGQEIEEAMIINAIKT